jgi:rRNA-processing protein FCF1
MESLTNVALDTNVLMYLSTFPVDVFTEVKAVKGRVKFVIPVKVFDEVKALGKKNLSLKHQSQIALQALNEKKVEIIETVAENADDALVELALDHYVIVTNDKELRKRIKAVQGECMFMRKKAFLVVEGIAH